MNPRTFLVASMVALVSASVMAETPAPKPGAEHQKLHYYLGRWSIKSDSKASPFGPAGKNSGTQVVEVGPGGFTIVFRSNIRTPAGPIQGLGLMGYDVGDKAYTYYGCDSTGDCGSGKGTIQDKTWSWTTEDRVGGKVIKGHFTLDETSATSYTYKYEMQGDDGAYSVVEEGKATKSK